MLARPAAEISIGAIIETLEGPCAHHCRYDNDAEQLAESDITSQGITDSTWRDLARQIDDLLGTVTIADMCARARRFGLRREGDPGFTYMI